MHAGSCAEARTKSITVAAAVAALALLAGTAAADRAAAEGTLSPAGTSAVEPAAGSPSAEPCAEPCAEQQAATEPEAESPAELRQGPGFRLRSAEAKPGKVFFAGDRDAKVKYEFTGTTTDVEISVVKRGSNELVSQFREDAQEPSVENVATWDGRDEAGDLVTKGELKFKVGPIGGAGEGTKDSRFDLYSHKFPLRARHTYGDGVGAGRGHQGQDVFANCGERLEAARAGEVQVKAFQSGGAGYYVVIDGRSNSRDYVYMHLKKPAVVREGESVKTGELIGKVGATGNASGCHLHFEYWKDDWFNGGKALSSVTRKLRQWDGWS